MKDKLLKILEDNGNELAVEILLELIESISNKMFDSGFYISTEYFNAEYRDMYDLFNKDDKAKYELLKKTCIDNEIKSINVLKFNYNTITANVDNSSISSINYNGIFNSTGFWTEWYDSQKIYETFYVNLQEYKFGNKIIDEVIKQLN